MHHQEKHDSQTTIAELRDEIRQFVEERDWGQFHSPKNLGMSIAIEAAEIMEFFQWYSSEQSHKVIQDKEVQALVADEMADVLIYCIILANQADVDISAAVRSKLIRNKERYPIGYMPRSTE
jgi:NTP pyrophosphatase (non-canonical NTP hydrolase)